MSDIPNFPEEGHESDHTQLVESLSPQVQQMILHQLHQVDPTLWPEDVDSVPDVDVRNRIGFIVGSLPDVVSKSEEEAAKIEAKKSYLQNTLLGKTRDVKHLQPTQQKDGTLKFDLREDDGSVSLEQDSTVLIFRDSKVATKLSKDMKFSANDARHDPLTFASLMYIADREKEFNQRYSDGDNSSS